MSRILSEEPITPKEFAIQYLAGDVSGIETIQDIWDYLDEHPEEEFWDYPLEELSHILENEGTPVVLVENPDGSEIRWFETGYTPDAGTYFNQDDDLWIDPI